jgi:hypothetical protein
MCERVWQRGKWYSDAIGRKWKLIEIHRYGESIDSYVILFRRRWHPFGYRIGMVEEGVLPSRATVFTQRNKFGWTTVYSKEEEEE